MFYSHQLLARKAPLGQIWMAATMHAKINGKKLICEEILNPSVPVACYSTKTFYDTDDDKNYGETEEEGSLRLRIGYRPITAQTHFMYTPNMKLVKGSQDPYGLFISKGMSTPLTKDERIKEYEKLLATDLTVHTPLNKLPFDDFSEHPDLIKYIESKYYPVYSKKHSRIATSMDLAKHEFTTHACLFEQMSAVKYFTLDKEYHEVYIEPTSSRSISRCIPESWIGTKKTGTEIYGVVRAAAKTGLQIIGKKISEEDTEFMEARLVSNEDRKIIDLDLASAFYGKCDENTEFIC